MNKKHTAGASTVQALILLLSVSFAGLGEHQLHHHTDRITALHPTLDSYESNSYEKSLSVEAILIEDYLRSHRSAVASDSWMPDAEKPTTPSERLVGHWMQETSIDGYVPQFYIAPADERGVGYYYLTAPHHLTVKKQYRIIEENIEEDTVVIENIFDPENIRIEWLKISSDGKHVEQTRKFFGIPVAFNWRYIDTVRVPGDVAAFSRSLY